MLSYYDLDFSAIEASLVDELHQKKKLSSSVRSFLFHPPNHSTLLVTTNV